MRKQQAAAQKCPGVCSQVAKVRTLHEAHPAVTKPIFEAMAAIANSFLELAANPIDEVRRLNPQ